MLTFIYRNNTIALVNQLECLLSNRLNCSSVTFSIQRRRNNINYTITGMTDPFLRSYKTNLRNTLNILYNIISFHIMNVLSSHEMTIIRVYTWQFHTPMFICGFILWWLSLFFVWSNTKTTYNENMFSH